MASLFGETPAQIRQRVGTTLAQGTGLFGNPDYAMIGAGLGAGLGGLFSNTRNPEIAQAQQMQKLQQQWGQDAQGFDLTNQQDVQKFGKKMISDLMGAGRVDMAMRLSQELGVGQTVDPAAEKTVQGKVDKLRSSINKFSGDMRIIDAAYTKIKRVAKEKTATGDMSMVFSIMKLNDPGSTVREGEYATAKNAGGVSDRLRNLYNNAIDGQLLQPGQRRNFLATADNLYQGQRESTDRSIDQALQFADQDQIPRERVLGSKRLKAFNKRRSTAGKASGLSAAEAKELEQLERELGTP